MATHLVKMALESQFINRNLKNLNQIKNFIFIGITTNFFGIILYFLLTSKNLPRMISLIFCYLFVMFMNYFLNRRITFKAQYNKSPSFYKFSLGYLNIFIFNIIFQSLLVDFLNLDHRYIQLIFLIISASISFIFQKKIVFRQ